MHRNTKRKSRRRASGHLKPDLQPIRDIIKDIVGDAPSLVAMGDDSVAFQVMDALDDEVIVGQLRGVAHAGLRPLAYEYTDGETGELVRNLSVVGVQECVREMGTQGVVLRIVPPAHYDLSGSSVVCDVTVQRVTVKGKKEMVLDSAIGGAQQDKNIRVQKTGAFITDKYAIPKAVSKAERNAKMKLIPEAVKDKVLRMALKEGRIFNPLPKSQANAEAKSKSQPTSESKSPFDPVANIVDFLAEMDKIREQIPIDEYLEELGKFEVSHPAEAQTPRKRSAILTAFRRMYKPPAMSMVSKP